MARHYYFWRPTLANVMVAVLGFPVAFAFNTAVKSVHPAGILVLAVAVLAAIVALLRQMAPGQPKIFYAFSLFAFTSVVDLLIPLEMDGWVEGFMDVYMVHGEPYLFSSWGALSAYWDGTFNLCCYIYMAFCVSNRVSYRYVAIFYAANILNSMKVLLMGAFLSGAGLHWCTLLNVPYVVVPAYVLWTALEEPAPKGLALPAKCAARRAAVPLLAVALVFNVLRGVAALGSPVKVMALYRTLVEPLMNQKFPAPFIPVQFIMNDFYFAVAFAVLAVALVRNTHSLWLVDLSIGLTGAALQAEVCLVGMQWHPMTDSSHHMPPDAGVIARVLHVCAHVSTLAAPALCAIALYVPRHYVAFNPDAKALSNPSGAKASKTKAVKTTKSKSAKASKTTNDSKASKSSSKGSSANDAKEAKSSSSKASSNDTKTTKAPSSKDSSTNDAKASKTSSKASTNSDTKASKKSDSAASSNTKAKTSKTDSSLENKSKSRKEKLEKS